MMALPANTRIWIAAGMTDLRRGFTGLSALVETKLEQKPFSGHVFVFRGRRGDLIKVLWYDGDGLCLFAKRLERGRFVWPQATSGTVALTRAHIFHRTANYLLTDCLTPGGKCNDTPSHLPITGPHFCDRFVRGRFPRAGVFASRRTRKSIGCRDLANAETRHCRTKKSLTQSTKIPRIAKHRFMEERRAERAFPFGDDLPN